MPSDEALDLAETFAEIASTLLAEKTLDATLQRVASLAVATIDGCDHAAISLVEGRRITTRAATDDVPRAVDDLQYETDEGPCLAAIRDETDLAVDDLAVDDRWPRFAPRAVEATGVRSMLAFQLFAEERTHGALNLYSREVAAFDDAARHVGAVFAAHASVALASARHVEELEHQVETRDIIGQAKGIIMASERVTDDEAFTVLRHASQRLNVKLRDVAAEVSRTGETPHISERDAPVRGRASPR